MLFSEFGQGDQGTEFLTIQKFFDKARFKILVRFYLEEEITFEEMTSKTVSEIASGLYLGDFNGVISDTASSTIVLNVFQ